MNDPSQDSPPKIDLQRTGAWLNGYVSVSRKVLVVGGLLLLVFLGLALD